LALRATTVDVRTQEEGEIPHNGPHLPGLPGLIILWAPDQADHTGTQWFSELSRLARALPASQSDGHGDEVRGR